MLQQVLRDMYIDPELLAELDEEQKQILFCKMREEQVRRWKENEEKLEKLEKKNSKKDTKNNNKVKMKTVGWLLASDGNPWVWVMGEHSDDMAIDDILEEEEMKKAELEALQELEKQQKQEELEFAKVYKEEQEKLQREKREKEELLRKQEEQALLESKKEALRKIKEEKQKQEELIQRKMKEMQRSMEHKKRASISSMMETKEQRQSQIFSTIREMRDRLLKLAERDKGSIDDAWVEQEKKAKQAEEEKRAIARRAREENRRSFSLQSESQIISVLMDSYNVQFSGQKKPDHPTSMPAKKPRAAKPPNRAAVIKWFKEEEENRGSGRHPKTKQVALWFHGIIGRTGSEEILEDKIPGTFLVRVSEKVYGYAVSLRSPVRCKHFLIDVTPKGYKFYGTNQLTHKSLYELVDFHKDQPISGLGQEMLLHPCGQCQDPPDTAELFALAESDSEISHL